jgi:hypothetical protein
MWKNLIDWQCNFRGCSSQRGALISNCNPASSPQFFNVFSWHRAFGAHFSDLIFQKCSETVSVFKILNCKLNRALATVSCTFCRQLFQIEACDRGNIDPTFVTPGATAPVKHRDSRASLHGFTRKFPKCCCHLLFHFPTTWWFWWWCEN